MKRIILLLTSGLLATNSFAQRVRIIETDSVTYFIDTQTFSSSWGGASYTGQHVGTNTGAYSQSNGYENTKKIVTALAVGSYPGYRCDTLILNNKTEWYLPSGDECKMVYKTFNSLKIFNQGWYWTSSDQDGKPYDNFWTYDAWAWKKWFGGGEGDIYELSLKIDNYPSFCILKERKITTGIVEENVTQYDNEDYKLYDLNGKESSKIINTVLIKKFANGRVEKVIYVE